MEYLKNTVYYHFGVFSFRWGMASLRSNRSTLSNHGQVSGHKSEGQSYPRLRDGQSSPHWTREDVQPSPRLIAERGGNSPQWHTEEGRNSPQCSTNGMQNGQNWSSVAQPSPRGSDGTQGRWIGGSTSQRTSGTPTQKHSSNGYNFQYQQGEFNEQDLGYLNSSYKMANCQCFSLPLNQEWGGDGWMC